MSSLCQFLTLYSFISAIKAIICIHPTEFHSNIWTVSENSVDCHWVDEIGVSSNSEISELAIFLLQRFQLKARECYSSAIYNIQSPVILLQSHDAFGWKAGRHSGWMEGLLQGT